MLSRGKCYFTSDAHLLILGILTTFLCIGKKKNTSENWSLLEVLQKQDIPTLNDIFL